MKIIHRDGTVSLCPEQEQISVLRHTAAHILAQAVKRLYPQARFAFGPATEQGFYYDVDLGDTKLTEAELPAIEEEMRRIVRESFPIKPFVLSRDDALALMRERGEDYKCEHIASLDDETFGFFRQGEYIDLCRGPHLTYTNALKVFRLTGVSGAYWKNDASRPMLTRISGTAFAAQEEMDAYFVQLEEAKRRDHRIIGREMDLFLFDDAGAGFPFFLPGGVALKNTLIEYWRSLHKENGYQEISTPQILNSALWKQSGHWAHYQDKMYMTEIDGAVHCIKPMNCPGGILVYNSRQHSYRELPLRMAELGLVHRNELHGTLHGLFRVRCLTQDDAHIFMTQEQITDEIVGVIRLIDTVYRQFGFSYSVELSTRPADSMGTDEEWAAATDGLCRAMEMLGLSYTVNEGDGAFYGPKLDFHLRDSIGRTWQCGTIQLDFQLPQNFDLTYIDEQNRRVRPIMLHRTCYGSIERFMGIITEHYAGRFPVWLAPVQVKILTLPGADPAYAERVRQMLAREEVRVSVDDRPEKIGYKVRQARQIDRVPYMLIVGEREEREQIVSVRGRGDQTEQMLPETFLAKIKTEIRNRT